MPDRRLRIELDAFSGRANPSWVLDARESDEVAKRLRPGSACTARPAGLGFRGFIIHNLGAIRPGTPTVRIWQGTISIAGPVSVSSLDTGHLEEYLTELAVARGYATLLGQAQKKREIGNV
jgi:hypothetical protein